MWVRIRSETVTAAATPGVSALVVAVLLSAAHGLSVAQPSADAAKAPPEWPTPAEYLAEKERRAGAPVNVQAPTDLPAAPPGESPAKPGPVPAQASPSRDTAGDGAGDSPGAVPAVLPPYTVQLGAFRDPDLAQQEAAKLNLEGVFILVSEQSGERWHVLVLGLYPTRDEASLAEQEYLAKYPDRATWLRTTQRLSHR